MAMSRARGESGVHVVATDIRQAVRCLAWAGAKNSASAGPTTSRPRSAWPGFTWSARS